MRYRLILVIAVAALLTAGCANASRTAEPASGTETPSGAATSAPATNTTTGAPSTGEIIEPPVGTPTKPPAVTGPPPGTGGCRPTMAVRVTPGARPEPICLPISAQLRVASDAAAHEPWSPLTSSNAKILSCTSTVGPDGTVTGTCTPHLSGTVTLTTATPPPANDPAGAPKYRWTLTVNVITYGFDN